MTYEPNPVTDIRPEDLPRFVIQEFRRVADAIALSREWDDYTPSSYTLTTGTLAAGDVTDVQTMLDGNTLDITEVTGVPGFDIEFNFTGIRTLPRFVVARWMYDGLSSHFVTIDIYNYITTNWDQVRVFTDSALYYSSLTMYLPKANIEDYVDSSGNAKLRMYHHTSGNGAHDLHIDYMGLTAHPS